MKSKINNVLCRMVSLPVVRHILKNDVMNLPVILYCVGIWKDNGVFYIAIDYDEVKTIE